jgi:2-dehydro-3-deoxyphosphogluconate aldolase/(4S)-4-hydroxy-2-oxoglutarate aldolase
LKVFESINSTKIVAILRGLTYEENLKVIECLIDSGITNLEVTLNTSSALETIKKARQTYKEAHIGAGTVINKDGALRAIEAGAEFLISPNLSEEVVSTAKSNGILMLPGVFSPTEIVQACQLGCKMVKLFPAISLGTKYIKQVRGPLDDIKIMVVGGIDISNAKDYLLNGADALGVGGSLIRTDLVKQGDYKQLKEHFLRFKESIR